MAYTKILVIHNRLDKCLNYAMNEEKTSLDSAIDYALNREKPKPPILKLPSTVIWMPPTLT
ncbi:MAG: hypothetical protein VB064_10390 [Oscillospiraceae bacterium]|nr:hypothetical protein [Oscillospiraceae bacterium]